ncbi:site-specific recombinase XerD [Chitinophaga skermanii]|uniref:Site-specific recombinase XerD n=1 Tax=Chitinophaga skermanii TaxID=331697 RepID=A0A327QJB8_9BACT|nr:site-specific integrase [Chitinophaga skermanii]RAJ04078.1 site-specific recombinase XerD [Chitinophaga skermanii]
MENKTLFELIAFHQNEMQDAVGNTRAIGPYKKHLLSAKKLESFVKYQYNQQDINLSDLQPEFIIDFENYLLNVLNHQPNTVRQHSIDLKIFVNFGVQNNWLDANPFKTHQTQYGKSKITILTMEKLVRVMAIKPTSEIMEIAKNLFLFQCFTGLGYAEILSLTKTNIQVDKKGKHWIILQDRIPIPLLPPALKILEKYNWQKKAEKKKLLPYIRSHSINKYLIEIIALAGISKKVTVIVVRRTFGLTVALNNGVPIEVVSKLLDHSNLTRTQEYLNLVDECPLYDFNLLRKKISEIF